MTHTNENRFKVYCGPTVVKPLADSLRRAGVHVTLEGTEHIYITALCSDEFTMLQVLKTHMHGFTVRDIHKF